MHPGAAEWACPWYSSVDDDQRAGAGFACPWYSSVDVVDVGRGQRLQRVEQALRVRQRLALQGTPRSAVLQEQARGWG